VEFDTKVFRTSPLSNTPSRWAALRFLPYKSYFRGHEHLLLAVQILLHPILRQTVVLERIEKLRVVEKADQIPRGLIEKGTSPILWPRRYHGYVKSDEEAASLSQ
jgi:hypothetical protein